MAAAALDDSPATLIIHAVCRDPRRAIAGRTAALFAPAIDTRRTLPRPASASASATTRIGSRRADRCGWAAWRFRTTVGLVGHSDADVLLHAVTDALLGAAALGDIGELFPDTDAANRGRDSAEMLHAAPASASPTPAIAS